MSGSYLIMKVASTPESKNRNPPLVSKAQNPELAAMAERAQGLRALLICLCLLLLSSEHLAMSMDLDGDGFFDVSLDDDDSFSDEVAAAPARRLSGDSFSVLSSNTSSNKSGSAFCRLLSLQILDLSNNLLTGELPGCWWEMQALQFMDLSNNSFSGAIPEAPPSHSCSLESLHLAGNGFTGSFPSVVKGCESLATLDIGNNQFFGRIPPWVGSGVPALKILRLSSNNFTGEILPEISQLPQLQLLDLANNSLTGPIPREFGKLSAMKNPIINSTGSLTGSNYEDRIDIIWKGQELIFKRILQLMTGIDLSGNSLSQCIPEELTNLQGLRFLNLSRNNLSCGIPENIGSLNVLESLDLSLNELSGAIPVGLSSMVSLNTLNLSNNHLSGEIPTGSQLQTLNDASIYSNNPGLCGPPLNTPCTNASPALSKRNDRDSDQWLYYCVIAGIVFGFWLWCGMILSIPKWRHSVFFFVDAMQYKIMLKLQPIDQYLFKEKSDPFL